MRGRRDIEATRGDVAGKWHLQGVSPGSSIAFRRCSIPTAPIVDQPTDADVEREILQDPKVQEAQAALDDPEDREDLIDALIVSRRVKEGKAKIYTIEEVLQQLGL